MQWRIIAKVSIWIYLSTEIHKKFSIKLQMQMQSQWNVQNINTWWLVVVEGDSLHPSLDTHGAGSHCPGHHVTALQPGHTVPPAT